MINIIEDVAQEKNHQAGDLKDGRGELDSQFPGLSLPNKNKEEIDLDLDTIDQITVSAAAK